MLDSNFSHRVVLLGVRKEDARLRNLAASEQWSAEERQSARTIPVGPGLVPNRQERDPAGQVSVTFLTNNIGNGSMLLRSSRTGRMVTRRTKDLWP